MSRLFSAAVLLFGLSLASLAHEADERISAVPLDVSVCELLRDPAAYNHRLVKVTGDVSRGFEDFTLSDGTCPKTMGQVWLELGGRTGSGVTYCCGVSDEARRDRPLVVEGMATSLREDAAFKQFQTLTRSSGREGGRTHATLVGVYFSGVKRVLPGGTFWVGYGNLGMFSLLVIEQVLVVEATALGIAKSLRPSPHPSRHP